MKNSIHNTAPRFLYTMYNGTLYNKPRKMGSMILYDLLVTVKAAPHECVIRTGQP